MKKSSRSKRSVIFVLLSVAFFVAALILAELQAVFISLGLVVFGGFMMLISTMSNERPKLQETEPEDELFV